MRSNKVSFGDNHEFLDKHIPQIERLVGKILEIDKISGGLVNHIYRIKGQDRTVYLKLRTSEFSALPDIRIDPDDIRYESKALDIFSGIFPEVFPEQLAFFRESSTMVLSDIMRRGSTLESLLNSNQFAVGQAFGLGALIQSIHAEFRGRHVPIREDGDNAYYASNLEYRLGFTRNAAIDSIIKDLKREPRQLILGDLSPKNICVSEGTFKVCDLETAHMGNGVFDLGFLAAHLILHTLKDAVKAHDLVVSLFEGYEQSATKTALTSRILKAVTVGIVLYRIDNKVIPYETGLNAMEKSGVIAGAIKTLEDASMSWHNIIASLTRNIV